MINNQFIAAPTEVKETAIFNANEPGEPTVQYIVNILADNRATVKIFLPDYPAEQSFYHLRDKYKDKAKQIMDEIRKFVADRGAVITYAGF